MDGLERVLRRCCDSQGLSADVPWLMTAPTQQCFVNNLSVTLRTLMLPGFHAVPGAMKHSLLSAKPPAVFLEALVLFNGFPLTLLAVASSPSHPITLGVPA